MRPVIPSSDSISGLESSLLENVVLEGEIDWQMTARMGDVRETAGVTVEGLRVR